MMTQPVMAQEVVEQTGEVVQQTEEDVSESDMAADYQMETDLAAEINVFSADNNETPIVSADPTGQEGDKDAEEGDKEPEIKTGWQTEEGKTYYAYMSGSTANIFSVSLAVGEKKQTAWADVAAPVINSVTTDEAGDFVVDFSAVIDAYKGADDVKVTMLQDGLEVSTQTFTKQADNSYICTIPFRYLHIRSGCTKIWRS